MRKMTKLAGLVLLAGGMTLSAMAQEVKEEPAQVAVVRGSDTGTGDLYQGWTRAIPPARMVVPYGLEVTFDKTTHVIFPAAVRYVDLGSDNIIASQAGDVINVLRVKAAVEDFTGETNLSVICEDGSYYAFNVKYAKEPEKLSIEMKDFLYSGDNGRLPSNLSDLYFKELGSESPLLVKLVMQSIADNNRRLIKHLGAKQFGLQFLLRGMYAHNGLLYINLHLKNKTDMPYYVDHVEFRMIDKKLAKQTAMQELTLAPLRAYNNETMVKPLGTLNSVWCLEQFSLPNDKLLEVTVYERNGGRHLSFTVDADDLLLTSDIERLRLKW